MTGPKQCSGGNRGRHLPSFYTTPSDPDICHNRRLDGPTPCWHPHCLYEEPTCEPIMPPAPLYGDLWASAIAGAILGLGAGLAYLFVG